MYVHRELTYPSGEVVHEEWGDPTLTTAEGEPIDIHPFTLKGTDGLQYGFRSGIRQDEEGGPIIREFAIAMFPDGVTLTEAEREDVYNARQPEDRTLSWDEARQRYFTTPEPRPVLDSQVTDWVDGAEDDERTTVIVDVAWDHPDPLPRAHAPVFEESPTLALELQLDRLVAIEDRTNRLESASAGLVSDLEDGGGELHQLLPIPGAVQVTLSAAQVSALASDSRVRGVHPAVLPTQGGGYNTGIQIRDATRVDEFWSSGYRGEDGSGFSSFPGADDMFVLVGDNYIDGDHPAWDDWQNGPSRIISTTCIGPSATNYVNNNSTSCLSTNNTGSSQFKHGNFVTGQAVADLTNDQDGNQGATWEGRRSGMAPEAAIGFIQTYDGGAGPFMSTIVNEILALNLQPDVFNGSFYAGAACNESDLGNDQIDVLAWDGTLVVWLAGNEKHSGSNCTLVDYATAPGAFTVGGTDATANDLTTAAMYPKSSRGGTASGRHAVDILAPAGRTAGCFACSGTLTKYNDAYGGSPAKGTSYAAPVVSGAAAVYKEHLQDVIAPTFANQPGVMQAHLLLQGDRYGSGYHHGTTDLQGAGRLSMRLFDNSDLTAPWGEQSWQLVVDDGLTYQGTMNLPTGTQEVRSALWWLEFNAAAGTVADVDVQYFNRSANSDIFVAGGSPGAKTLRFTGLKHWPFTGYNTNIDGSWTWQLIGTSVPALDHAQFPWTDKSRQVVLAHYWEG